jgi:hypothetical protein
MRVAALATSLWLASCAGESPYWFEDEAAARGIDFTHRSGQVERAMLPEIVGGGAALFDVDGDGDLDAYFVQSGWNLGERPTPDTPVNRLYLNDGAGRFTTATDIGDAADNGYGMGAATGDYDGDGDVDLYVTNLGANRLLRNDGAGKFVDVTDEAEVGDPSWSTAATFADFDRDGDLDLFVVNYVHWSLAVERDCFSRGQPTYCAPTAYDAPAMDRLYRNDGNGRFTDVTEAAGLNTSFGNGLGTVAEDFNNDGLIDLFVANDRMKDQLWVNQGDLRFADEAGQRGVAMDDNGIAKAGMGVAVADVDHDDDADLIVVNFEGETDSFYRNELNYFVDVTARAGISMASRKRTRFGVVLADFNNDGQVDLFEANGKVDGNPNAATDVFAEPNALFAGKIQEEFVRFTEIENAGLAAPSMFTSRSAAIGDVNGDGRLDILIVNRDAPAQLLINSTPAKSWITLDVRDAVGAPALGAVVKLTAETVLQRATVRSSSSYLSAHDPRVHIGLGQANQGDDVTVTWPDGHTQSFGSLAAGKTHVLKRQ